MMFAKLMFKMRKPKFCRYCGKELKTDEVFVYDERTGLPKHKFVGVRCQDYNICFEDHGYLYKWDERVTEKDLENETNDTVIR